MDDAGEVRIRMYSESMWFKGKWGAFDFLC
jgi:hypothetical protein